VKGSCCGLSEVLHQFSTGGAKNTTETSIKADELLVENRNGELTNKKHEC